MAFMSRPSCRGRCYRRGMTGLPLLLLLSLPSVARAGDDAVHALPPSSQELEALDGNLAVAQPLAIPAAQPQPPPPGWHQVAPPTASSGANRAASGAVSSGPPPGWREVGAAASIGPQERTIDSRRLGIGVSTGGGATFSGDALIRLSTSTIMDVGLGLQLDRNTGDLVALRGLAGLTWQPGHGANRHGLFTRVGAGTVYDGTAMSLGMAGYAWRLVPRRSPISLEAEVAPGFLYRQADETGREWVAIAMFARLGAHLWF